MKNTNIKYTRAEDFNPNTNRQKLSLGIRSKLLFGFVTVAIILLISVGFILNVVNNATLQATQTIKIDLPFYDYLLDLQVQMAQAESAVRGWSLTSDPTYKDRFKTSWNNISRIEIETDRYAQSLGNDTFSKWTSIKSLLNDMQAAQIAILNASTLEKNQQTFLVLIEKAQNVEDKILDISDGLPNAHGERVGGMNTRQYKKLLLGGTLIVENLNNIRTIEFILMGIIVLVSLGIASITANHIVTPLKNAIDIAKRISEGEREVPIEITSSDETGQLLQALKIMHDAIKDNEIKIQESERSARELFDNIVRTAQLYGKHSSKIASGDLRQRLEVVDNDVMTNLGNDLNTMTEGLAEITRQITNASHNMVTTIEEVKNAVNVQSSGATEQASSINQITASLEEIETSSEQTMEKAKTLGEMAERTRAKGQLGLEAVEQSIQGMKAVREKVQMIAQTILDLSQQTQQVGEITAAVNALAQQSKMLALNASIEAAKAGEAGKGFSVVASEVKNLAEQSEQSTTQVQKILEDIRRATEKAVMVTEEGTKGVDQGTGLVEQTGEIIRGLSEVIHETTMASQQIEAAVRQEGVGIEQITAGMNEINQVTTSFVASANQTIEAIGNLSAIAKNLKERVDTYKI